MQLRLPPAPRQPIQRRAMHGLLHAAQQFEGVMLTELMKPLSQSTSMDGETPDGEAGTMQSFGVEAMAGALARSGALGFAHRIVASVEGKEVSSS